MILNENGKFSNKVSLLGHYGSDTIIACSAWTSTSRNLTQEKVKRIPALIKKLWNDGHHTPTEKGMVHFLLDTDIASHIHLLKHRLSSANSESSRYKELKEDKVYIPEDWRGQAITDTNVMALFDTTDWAVALERCSELTNYCYHKSVEELTVTLGRKRAKETARFFKMYNSQIQCDITFNMRSFHNFLTLRNSLHAQVEIREIAAEMLRLVSEIEGNPFEHTLKAWGY